MVEILFIFLSISAAYVYGGILEWSLHKYILHGLGKNKKSIFSFHWHIHHKTCRKNNNFDTDYCTRPLPSSIKKEIFFLASLVMLHLPYFFIAPYFFIGLFFYTCRYFYYHRRSHLDVEWAKKNMLWHYEHHTGKNQNANYGVTVEWPDKLFNTRRTE